MTELNHDARLARRITISSYRTRSHSSASDLVPVVEMVGQIDVVSELPAIGRALTGVEKSHVNNE